MKRPISIFITLVMILSAVALGIWRLLDYQTSTVVIKEDAFKKIVGDNVQINIGVTMQKIQSGDGENRITFAVLNHTAEAVSFSDRSFGLVVYQYEDSTRTWEVVGPILATEQDGFTLPAKVESLNFEISNWTMLSYERMMPLSFSGPARVYVEGTGQLTGKKYGAYIDDN